MVQNNMDSKNGSTSFSVFKFLIEKRLNFSFILGALYFRQKETFSLGVPYLPVG